MAGKQPAALLLTAWACLLVEALSARCHISRACLGQAPHLAGDQRAALLLTAWACLLVEALLARCQALGLCVLACLLRGQPGGALLAGHVGGLQAALLLVRALSHLPLRLLHSARHAR